MNQDLTCRRTLCLLCGWVFASLLIPGADLEASDSVWSRLASLGAHQRLNAFIELELPFGAEGAAIAKASRVESLWKLERFDEALEGIVELGYEYKDLHLGIRWLTPVASGAGSALADVRVGTLANADAASLDWDRASGTLLAVVDWGSSAGWGLYSSTDGGASWNETYFWCCGSDQTDLVVVSGFAYLAYTVGTEVKLRRAVAATGGIDAGYGPQDIIDTSPSTPTEITLTSNADSANDRIDYTILQSDGTVHHLYGDATTATGFTDSAPAIAGAESGISTAWNTGWPTLTGDDYLVMSFIAIDDSIQVYRLGGTGWDAGTPVETGKGSAESTSIAAFEDTFLVAYEEDLANGQGISYRISYDGGSSWSGATLATPASGEHFYEPIASARSGSGLAVSYQQLAMPENLLFLQERSNYTPGTWSNRTRVNDYDFDAGTTGFDSDWIGHGWGTVYIDAAGAVWFTLSDSIFYSGFEGSSYSEWSSWEGGPCVPGTDSDGDRLDDCVETNTGVFVGATDTGTNPNQSDTDGDSISDGDETLGTLGGLDLPAMGTNPLRKDVLVEYDWMSDALTCALHDHRPTAAMIDRLTVTFESAPVTNPDGSTGIHYIHDYGQGGIFTGGNLIADDGILVGGVGSAEFLGHKAANFAANRNGYFHYVILPHRYNTNSSSSGQAEINGDDLIVSLRCGGFNTLWVSNTIAHELGHNLGLRHGGFQNCNYKPNYNSVMNYKYQLNGVDTDCDTDVDGALDYSYGDRVTLDENNLDETVGVCGAPPFDWNSSGTIETGVSHDVNTSGNSSCGGTLTTLLDSDDWGSLSFSGILDSDRPAPRIPLEIIDCANPEVLD